MENNNRVPLAQKMRPQSLEDFVGQEHIVGKNCLLRRSIAIDRVESCIFYGPPGTGKTTLANIIAKTLNGEFISMNAVSSGVADAKLVIEKARTTKSMFGTQTYLLLDECHRWNKSQSDCVLSAIEDGSIIFIGSTTENPFTNMTRAIVSRCRVFEFKPLLNSDIIKALKRTLTNKDMGLGNLQVKCEDDALQHIAWASGGDLRMAIGALELAVYTTDVKNDGTIYINKATAEQSIQKKALSIDETMFYDILSAFCKSLRGSDSDAALYYSQRLILAGCDPLLIARRVIAHASEDVGMADSNALLIALNAYIAIEKMGIAEAQIPLSHAIIYVCEAEKSNSVYKALTLAKSDAENIKDDNVPFYLKNHPSTNDTKKTKYKYPHDYGGYVKQQYLPDSLKNKIYYTPSSNGKEKKIIRKKFDK
ncbi:MAG: replication-associated recombination protein A [Clostridia bacterium]